MWVRPYAVSFLNIEHTHGHSYIIKQISFFNSQLEEDRDKRAVIYRKFWRGVNVIDAVDITLHTASTGIGIVRIGILSNIVAVRLSWVLKYET